ncbi:MAG: chorismate synthase [Ardenticatenia bacterium]|nr:chorismate synthase [Ardenticatenia bacterium]
MSLRFLTAGESHGPELTAILEGLPAGLRLDQAGLDGMMARRQTGFGSGGRMKIERDAVRISGGLLAGLTTGAPLGLTVPNRDHAGWRGRDVPPMTIPRPGHADLSAAIKYGYRDLRAGLERASARETAARVAVGAVCAQLLAAFGVELLSYVTAVGHVQLALDLGVDAAEHRARAHAAEADALRCPDQAAGAAMREAVAQAVRDRDTLGGLFVVAALGLPPGLGSHVHWDRRLGGRLLAAVGSIPAVKGVEIGPAFANASLPGTAVHDPIERTAAGELRRRGGRGGGLEGGITTGEPLVLRAAMKPISTTLTPLDSVDLATGETAPTRYERSDFCAVPRAAVVAEAMLAFVLADAFLEKLGGDHLDELLERLGRLRQSRLTDLPMDATPWRPWPDNDDEPVPADSDSADSAADPAAADSAADPATDAPHAL